jgi:tetratricopeptide (TPR) repeat protein
MVPERLHLTGIATGDGPAGRAIAARLKHQSFAKVAGSIRDGGEVSFSDLGWIARDRLDAARHSAFERLLGGPTSDIAVAASLHVGQTAEARLGTLRQFVHLEEVRPSMACDRAIARYPNDRLALTARATWERTAGNYRAALADYSAVIRLDPTSYAARYERALTYYVMGDSARAFDDITAAFEANSPDANGYTLRGLIEEARGEDDLATADEGYAIAQYQAAGSDDSGARYALGVAYANLGYFEAAIDELDPALKKNPDNAFAYQSRGFAWFSRGVLEKAAADFTAASRAKPKAVRPYLGLAMLSFSKGDAAAALEHAREASTADPGDAYAALWILVAGRALQRAVPLAGQEAFAASAAWPAPIIRVYLGRTPVESLEAAASSPDPFTQRRQLCEARFYRAAYTGAAGEGASALALYQDAVRDCPYREYERAAAAQVVRGREPAR